MSSSPNSASASLTRTETTPESTAGTAIADLSESASKGLSRSVSRDASEASAPVGPSLGQRLKIRSMVTMAGEVLPFFWPMRNFIHHNPLHGLEHLSFEQAVAEASRLLHARGWLRRTEYQRMLAEGDIDLDTLEALVSDQVDAWLRDNVNALVPEQGQKQAPNQEAEHGRARDLNPEYSALLKRLLMAMLTALDQPAPGDRSPCAEEVLTCLRNPTP